MHPTKHWKVIFVFFQRIVTMRCICLLMDLFLSNASTSAPIINWVSSIYLQSFMLTLMHRYYDYRNICFGTLTVRNLTIGLQGNPWQQSTPLIFM